MLSAPATIPATIEDTLPAASDPADPGTVTVVATRAARPARRANRITGTNPAAASRFGSSNFADTVGT